jgi:hypothetical protein
VIQWKNLAELARTGTPPKTLAEFQTMLANIGRAVERGSSRCTVIPGEPVKIASSQVLVGSRFSTVVYAPVYSSFDGGGNRFRRKFIREQITLLNRALAVPLEE